MTTQLPAQLPAVGLDDPNHFITELRQSIPASVVGLLRKYMGDYAERNRLLRFKDGDPILTGQEFEDEDYLMGIADTISYMNTEEPIEVVFAPGMPIPRDLLMGLGVAQMLEMALTRRLRNEIVSSDGGQAVDTQKYEKYKALKESLRNEHRDRLRRYKRGLNSGDAWGSLSTSFGWSFITLR